MQPLRILPLLGALTLAPSLYANGWSNLGGQAIDVASGGGQVYAIQKDQSVVYYSNGSWLPYPGGVKALAIETDANGTPYIASADYGIYRGTGSGWSALPRYGSGFVQVAVDGKGVVHGLDGYKNLAKFEGNSWHGVATSVNGIASNPHSGCPAPLASRSQAAISGALTPCTAGPLSRQRTSHHWESWAISWPASQSASRKPDSCTIESWN